jgi:hypothetical protein
VSARVPLDVDLEDKLLYGLTPTKLAYLVVSLLAAFSVGSTHWAPVPARVACAIVIGVVGIAAAWGRYRGRALDSWIIDLVVFWGATYRLRWKPPRLLGRQRARR